MFEMMDNLSILNWSIHSGKTYWNTTVYATELYSYYLPIEKKGEKMIYSFQLLNLLANYYCLSAYISIASVFYWKALLGKQVLFYESQVSAYIWKALV